MLEKLENIKIRWEEVGKLMEDPDVVSDMDRFIKLSKEYKELEKIVNAYLEYKNVIDNISSSKIILSTEKDEESKEMAKEELEDLAEKKIHIAADHIYLPRLH